MKVTIRFVLMFVIVAVLAVSTQHVKADDDDSGTVTSLTCDPSTNSITVSFTGSPDEDIDINVNGIFEYFDIDGGLTSPITFTDPIITNGTVLSVDSQPNIVVTCGASVTVKFCDLSADGRVNGLCGDRIVVYCNKTQTPPNVDVWVIDNSSVGHELVKLPLSDLTSVPEGKYAKNLGANGVIYAGADSSGDVYVALQGGPYGGTAKGDWLKSFSCKG